MKKLIFASVIIIFLLSSCSLLPFGKSDNTDAVVAALQATRDAQNTAATANAAIQQAPTQAPPTEAPTIAPPTETATEVPPTATPTEVPVVKVVANVNANCRFGPDKSFANDELLIAGTSAVVTGQVNTNGQWWKVTTANGKECWVLGDNVSISGDTSTIALLEMPKTPTPVPPPSWAGFWYMGISLASFDPTYAFTPFTATINQNGNELKFGFKIGSYTFNVDGVLSADGMAFDGNLNQQPGDGNWEVHLRRNPQDLTQFRGRWNVKGNANQDGAFCGYSQLSSGFPSPCRP